MKIRKKELLSMEKTRKLGEKKVDLISYLSVAIILTLFAIITFAEGGNTQSKPTGNIYKQEDLIARYTRDHMFYQFAENKEITEFDKRKYYEILKKVLADYPQSSFAPAWQLAIATKTNKLKDLQKVIRDYRGHDFISAIAYTKIGEIYRSEGKNKKAKKSFQKAISLINRCIKNGPKNAVYNYHKAIIMMKEKNETLDGDWKKTYPDGRLMDAGIFSELKKGTNKNYCYTPFLEINNILEYSASIVNKLSRRLSLQGNYYEKKGEIDKAIETYETMLKIGKHYLGENQILITETPLGSGMWSLGRIFLERLFVKNKMMGREKKLEIANKIVEKRKNKINLILSVGNGYGRVITKNLSGLPAKFQVDKEKTIREAKKDIIEIIEKNNLIKDKNLESRIVISYILSRLGGERAIAILKEGLNDKDSYVRFFVKKILEEH